MKTGLAFAVWMSMASPLFATDYFVAQQDQRAAESNPGTEALPFKTISNACAAARAGDTVNIKAGTYREALIPKHSGAKGKPITFQAYRNDFVMIKGSERLTGLVQEATNLWVKRPWTREGWWDDRLCRGVSGATYQDSARVDQVFVNETPLQWVPSRKELKPGCFYWNVKKEKQGKPADGELVICPPEGVADLNQALVEIPVLFSLLCAWQGDPGGLAGVRSLRRDRPEQAGLWREDKWPQIHYIHVKGLHFRHAAHTLNRDGVRLDGDHWLLESCTVEYMNCVGVNACGDHGLVLNCVVNHNGQSGLSCSTGVGNVFENCVTFYNNRKLFSLGWGGAGNKLCVTDGNVVRGLISAFNYGSGLWYDIDCRDTLVENCLVFGNRPINAGYFYEISWDGLFRRNIAFANHAPGSGFYGAAFLMSDSASTRIEDNMAIGGSGGVSVGAGRRGRDDKFLRPEMKVWTACSNTVQRNLILEPHDFALCVRRSEVYDSTLPQANNRFLNNTVLAKHGSSRVLFGYDAFATPEAFDAAVGTAKGNRKVTDLDQLDRKSRAKLDEAFKRILNALALAEPKLELKLRKVRLEAIWSLESESKVIGYWAKGDGRRFLLLDLPQPATIQVLDPGAGGDAVLWDYPVLKPAVKTALQGHGGVFSMKAEGPMALVLGLSPAARSLSEVFSVRAQANGRPVQAVPEGQSFDVALQVRNPFPATTAFSVAGPGLSRWAVTLPPAGAAATNVALTASGGSDQLTYEISAPRMATNRRTVRVQVEKPATATYLREATVDPRNPAGNRRVGLPELKIAKETQHVKGLYDLATGRGWQGPRDLSGTVVCGWNEQALYILAQVQDDALATNRGPAYDRDCVEVFLDGRVKEFGQRIYTPGAHHFFFRAPAPGPASAGWQPVECEGDATNGVSGRCRVTTNGYEIEAAVSWALFPELKPTTGVVMGVDVALDDADYPGAGGRPLRITQLVWHGNGDNWRDASLLGLMKLNAPAEADFGAPMKSGDIVTRDYAGVVAVYREADGPQPRRVIPLRVDGYYRGSFVGGSICFDAEGNFYFLDGDKNFRVQMLPAGQSRSRILGEIAHVDDQENPYIFGINLIAPGRDRLLVLSSSGHLIEFCPSTGTEGEWKRAPGTRGGGLSLSPDGRWLAVASGSEYGHGFSALKSDDLKVVGQLEDDSGLVRLPRSLAFVQDAKPFLAVASGFVPVDDPSLAPAARWWKDGGVAAFKASTNSRMHVLRFECDPVTGKITPPASSNVKDGKSFSLASHRAAHGDLWSSAFEAIAVDDARQRVLLCVRSPLRPGAHIYAAPLDAFRRGGLTLSDCKPVPTASAGCPCGIAVAP